MGHKCSFSFIQRRHFRSLFNFVNKTRTGVEKAREIIKGESSLNAFRLTILPGGKKVETRWRNCFWQKNTIMIEHKTLTSIRNRFRGELNYYISLLAESVTVFVRKNGKLLFPPLYDLLSFNSAGLNVIRESGDQCKLEKTATVFKSQVDQPEGKRLTKMVSCPDIFSVFH